MRLLLLLVFVSFIFAGCSQGLIPHVRVILGDAFTLPENCQTDEQGDLYRLDLYGTPEVKVAAHKQGLWTPTEVYRERIGKNSSVVFNPAVYTDTGVYELRCGDRRVDVQVKVVMSSERCVSEGDAVSLPCYFSTTGKARWSVRWEKNGEEVLKRNSWEVTGAAEGRLSLSPDWVSHGNFSLTLKQAQKDDQGDYFCYIQDEVVIAVRLTVTGQRSLDQSSSTRPPFVPPTPRACEESRILPAVIITAVVCLPVGLLIGWLMTSCCPRGASYRRSTK
ncbi:uncharacterized protein LOC102076570 [Oreochromis niloticus]|uniref:uncharacterized protein LOC102076570 n=1 Tax=Oreochromis niloticus TaxID=8128 RepID=UPI0003944571|nr:uncharacterized protein LOC102076570 [Oreochromis niloticus]CAI5671581.1 unnamed protein product [Mustela putorius furo]